MKTREELDQFLDSPIPREVVKQREGGGGRSLSYLEGHYVIDRLNKAFGPTGWSSCTNKLECVYSGHVNDKYGKDVFTVHYIAQVTLSVTFERPENTSVEGYVSRSYVEHMGTGYGDGSDKNNPGKAYELAVKEAETDALKRAAIRFGQSMGLALYDKEQKNVSDAEEVTVEQSKPKEAEAAPEANLLGLISSTSKVLVAKRVVTLDQLKAELKSAFGVEQKESLNPSQAKTFLEFLNQKLKSGAPVSPKQKENNNGQTSN